MSLAVGSDTPREHLLNLGINSEAQVRQLAGASQSLAVLPVALIRLPDADIRQRLSFRDPLPPTAVGTLQCGLVPDCGERRLALLVPVGIKQSPIPGHELLERAFVPSKRREAELPRLTALGVERIPLRRER